MPTPTSTPQNSTSCQLAVIVVDSAEPAAINSSAADSTGRTPKRSIRAAANGAVRPNSVMLTDMASPTVPWDQPNSWCRGFIITPGTERKPAAPRIAMKLTAATTQAQWTRGRRPRPERGPSEPVSVLPRLSPDHDPVRGRRRLVA